MTFCPEAVNHPATCELTQVGTAQVRYSTEEYGSPVRTVGPNFGLALVLSLKGRRLHCLSFFGWGLYCAIKDGFLQIFALAFF